MTRPSSRPGGQTPRPRRRSGRTSPTNGSVTRADLHAIHAEFMRGTAGLYTPGQLEAIREHLVYLVGAITDYRHPPAVKRKMRNRWKARKAKPQPSPLAPTLLEPRASAAA